MEFYYSKKKIFLSFQIWLVSLLAIVGIYYYVSTNADSLLPVAIVFLSPIVLVASIYLVRFAYLLLIPEKLMLRIDDQGLLLNMNKTSRKAGLIAWNGISGIVTSTDNMNKPAIRISLEGHINSMYQFYITGHDAKKMGVTLNQLFDVIMEYYKANKR